MGLKTFKENNVLTNITNNKAGVADLKPQKVNKLHHIYMEETQSDNQNFFSSIQSPTLKILFLKYSCFCRKESLDTCLPIQYT